MEAAGFSFSIHVYFVRQDQINKAKVRSNLEAASFSCSISTTL